MTKARALEKRYILYARKSTTSEDRQVASIESQIEVMQEVAKEHGLKVIEVMSEAGSGFKIGRKVFNKMLERIENGEAEGIVVWKLSRLSRNPDDAGKIMGMLQRSQIKHIRTVERNWMPEDNVMMMYVEFGLTNQFSRDLSSDTKRGLIKKAERGWMPSAILPLGYMHSPYKKLGDEEIIADEKNFSLITNTLKSVASLEMTPVQGLEYLQSVGVTGQKGKVLAPSTYYDLLVHPLYQGAFEYPLFSGKMYESKAPRAITDEEHESILIALGRKDRPRPKTHFLPYTGLMKCGECGCSITAEKKHKKQKNGNLHDYVYYRCTKKKGDCGQPCTNVETLEKQFSEILARIKIPQAFHEWAIEEIKKDQEKSIVDRSQSIDLSRKRYDECLKQLDNLVGKYLEGKVPEDYYNRKLTELEKEKEILKGIADCIDERVSEEIKEIDRDLGFAVTAYNRFTNGDDHVRKEIISYLGSNLMLTDHSLAIELKRPLEGSIQVAELVNTVSKRFEPLENVDNRLLFKSYMSSDPVMGGRRDSNPRSPLPQSGALDQLSYIHHA